MLAFSGRHKHTQVDAPLLLASRLKGVANMVGRAGGFAWSEEGYMQMLRLLWLFGPAWDLHVTCPD